MMKIALAGNPNSGKTTLFNLLTGSRQFVGNWPGVTVEKKEGKLIKLDSAKDDENNDGDIIITDLPGIYSLSPYTLEEVVARDYLINEQPDAILNIIDGTNLERNLYLTTQLIEIGIPTVVAVNMMDVVTKRGDELDLNGLKTKFGCEVVEVSALKETGIENAIKKVISTAKTKSNNYNPLSLRLFSTPIEDAISLIRQAIVHSFPDGLSNKAERFYSIKVFERDKRVMSQLKLSDDSLNYIENIIKSIEKAFDDDSESIITNERYLYITSSIKDYYKKKTEKKSTISDKIDNVITNRFLAFPIFGLIMFLVYYLSVSVVGGIVTPWANDGIFGNGGYFLGGDKWIDGIPVILEDILVTINCAPWLRDLVVNGIVGGVGAVLGFVPQMMVLFTMLAFLEACGYMSRIAFILDRIFRKFGLSGKSFIPLLIGTGCSVPGIMASRTIENESDRRMTIITTSFVPCGAKLPVIALISSALFGGAWWLAPVAYFIGITAVIVSGVILKKTKLFKSEVTPFIMELPPYHMPTFKSIMHSMWERASSFIKKAGTIILISSIIIWIGSVFGRTSNGFGFDLNMNLEDSIIGIICRSFSWVFIPLGFGTTKSTIATIMGLIAKEEIVAVFGVFDLEGMTRLSALSFLIFNLLCSPCIAAVATIKREMNSLKWTVFAIGYQTVFAYAISLSLFQIGSAFSGQVNIVGFVFSMIIIMLMVYVLLAKRKTEIKKC